MAGKASQTYYSIDYQGTADHGVQVSWGTGSAERGNRGARAGKQPLTRRCSRVGAETEGEIWEDVKLIGLFFVLWYASISA